MGEIVGGVIRTLPLYEAFDCTGCGQCCRDWRIVVDRTAWEGAVALLESGDHPGRVEATGAFDMLESPTEEAFATLRTREDGTCVFLDPDNLCYWHRHFGYETKGWVCRAFPNTTYKTPTSTTVTGTLSCRPMVEMMRDRFSAPMSFVEVTEGFGAALERPRWTVLPRGAIWLQGDALLDGAAIDDVQASLLEILGVEGLSLGVRLRMCRAWLARLEAAGGEGPSVGAERVVGLWASFEVEATQVAIEAIEARGHWGLMTRATRALFARMARVGMPRRRAEPFAQWIEALGLDAPPELVELRLRKLHAARFAPHLDELEGLLGAYASHRIVSSHALPVGGIVPMMTEVMISVLLVWAVAVAMAEAGDRGVDADTLADAIHAVDLIFFHAPVFEAFFSAEAGLSSIHAEAFAASLTVMLCDPAILEDSIARSNQEGGVRAEG